MPSIININDINGGGVSLLTVFIAPLGIDESENKYRYLNGQILIQSQFPAATAAIKSLMTTMANAFTTEVNWQAEKTQSKLGQCGKFVVDDTAGTIRLPCVINAQGLADLSLIGGIKSESLPNINGSCDFFSGAISDATSATGSFKISATGKTGTDIPAGPTSGTTYKLALEASPTYQDNAPVQQEAVQYPYCIVVNTGVEEADRPINNYQVNNVYSYGMSQYYKGTMNNNSWIKSAGQWNDGTVYTGMYNWLLEQMNAGVSGFLNSVMYAYSPSGSEIVFTLPKLTPRVGMVCYGWSDGSYQNRPISVITAVTDDGAFQADYQGTNYVFVRNPEKDQTTSYPTDYDFVVNTTDQTFRLPLKNGQEGIFADCVKGNGMSIGLATGTGNMSLGGQSVIAGNSGTFGVVSSTSSYGAPVGTAMPLTGAAAANSSFGLTADPTKSGMVVDKTVPAGWNLYYYIGDTLQNAQLINVARIEETVVNKTNKVQAAEASMPSNRYIDLTLGATGASYTSPANGWFYIVKMSTGANQYIAVIHSSRQDVVWSTIAEAQYLKSECLKGETVNIGYNTAGITVSFRFIYAEGENS